MISKGCGYMEKNDQFLSPHESLVYRSKATALVLQGEGLC